MVMNTALDGSVDRTPRLLSDEGTAKVRDIVDAFSFARRSVMIRPFSQTAARAVLTKRVRHRDLRPICIERLRPEHEFATAWTTKDIDSPSRNRAENHQEQGKPCHGDGCPIAESPH